MIEFHKKNFNKLEKQTTLGVIIYAKLYLTYLPRSRLPFYNTMIYSNKNRLPTHTLLLLL